MKNEKGVEHMEEKNVNINNHAVKEENKEANIEVKKDEFADLLKKENIILLACSLALGILFDILFFDKPMGISCPIFVVAFYGIFFWRLKGQISLKFDPAWLLSVPVLALSFTYFIFSNQVFKVLNLMAIPILIVAQTVLLSRNNNFRWFSAKFIGDILFGLFIRPLMNLFTPFILLARIIKSKSNPGRYETVGKILIGVAISVPLLFVVTMLLASADQVFEHFLGNLPDIFGDIAAGELFAQIIIALIIGFAAFSYIFGLAAPADRGALKPPEDIKPLQRFWDPVIVVTVLVSINLVYVMFTLIQFSYLFGSVNLGLPKDFTYAEYARRGFFELVFVTLINLSILLGCIGFTKQGNRTADRIMKILMSLLVGCTMVMLISAHIRMSLYEEAYGYTYLRLLTHAFMFFIFALLIVAGYRVWVERVEILKWYISIALISYVLINYANIDVMIAKNNIERYRKTDRIDISYLTVLSYDAVPYTVELLKDKNSEVAAGIENDLYLKKKKLEENRYWQSFNISEYMARNILKKYELKFDETAVRYPGFSRD